MKVLIDQNISHRIVPEIAFLFAELSHVKDMVWMNWEDYRIFMSARKLQYVAIITLNEDFNKLLLQHGTPPKLIWLKSGNCSTGQLARLIISHREAILNFLTSDTFDCLELYG
jgi:predicted nuclease of predicted toxin-antitoxin system